MVQFATSDATATAGRDYTATTGTLTFGAGETSKAFTVPILADQIDEPNETLTVTLSNVTGGAVLGTPSTATVTIADVDTTPCRTTLSADVPVGSTSLPVMSQVGCAVGDHISINPGAPNEEREVIAGFGSILIDQPTARPHAAGEPVVRIDPTADLGRPAAVPRPEDDTDKPRKETETERQQRERTDRSGKDDVHAEGNVTAVACEAAPPTVTIANRDGLVTVRLLGEAAKACGRTRVGDYLEADGEKLTEQLFEATDVNVQRR
jgi:hypothetical protein